MTLRVRLDPAAAIARFGRDQVVRVGRARANEVRVGHQRVGGRWTVSQLHAEIRWDGNRWSTANVSARHGLLHVYEPGYEEVPLEPGRTWVPVRHRWALALGRPEHRFAVVCATDDHRRPVDDSLPSAAVADLAAQEDPTMSFEGLVVLPLTALEREVLLAYYSGFTMLPRPSTLEPRSHDDAARRLGRSRASARKAIERVNEKVAAHPDAPSIATGRNVSAEIGRWLARVGALDPE